MNKKHLLFPLLALPFVLASCDFSSNSADGPSVAENNATAELESTHQVLSTVYLYYKEVGAITDYLGKGSPSKGGEYADVVYMFSTLSDQFTRYFTPLEANEALGYYMGDSPEAYIGIKFQVLNDTIQVIQVVPDGPAADAGIRKYDQILKVNGTDVTGTHTANYPSLTEGGDGTAFDLTLRRGTDTLSVHVTKDVFDLPTVWLDTLQGVPVIQVDFFAASNSLGQGGTADEFDAALSRTDGYKVVIIDLRDNPGGSVEECLRMTDALLEKGIIVYQMERTWDEELQATVVDTSIPRKVRDDGTIYEEREYVFLANKGSASCSEIMLAGVEYSTDWPIVGTQSYGKGIAQGVAKTPAGGLMVVTTTEFRNGNKEDYHHIGIAPTIEVTDPDSVLAVGLRTAHSIQDTLGRGASQGLVRHLARTSVDHEALRRVDALHTQRPERPNGMFLFR